MVREKSLSKKKSKKPLIISLIVAGILVAAGAVYYFVLRDTTPKIVLSDTEFLVSVESWEKVDAPTVIWVFKGDGKGELTTNKSNYYETSWSLSGANPEVLKISTAWLYELNDSFEFLLNRDEKSFTVKNLADETESTFVPLGTQAENTEDSTKTE